MAAAKIVAFLRGDKPGAFALTGPTGCGKRYLIAGAARQAGVVITHHDLAQGAVAWGRLGGQQLTANELARCVHVVSNASEQFLHDFAIVKKTRAKHILVADDAGPSLRASKAPLVRMQAMSGDAMAKKLFLELEAVAAARAAKGDWHQLHARTQLCPDQGEVPQECSGKGASIADAPPCFVTNQLLNGTEPESCPLDHSVVAWTERNLGLHCKSIEDMAAAQETMASASTCLYAGDFPSARKLFRQAARLNTRRAQYQPSATRTHTRKTKAPFAQSKKASRQGIWRTHRVMSSRRKRQRSRKRKPGELPRAARRPNVLPESPRHAERWGNVKWRRFGLSTATASAWRGR